MGFLAETNELLETLDKRGKDFLVGYRSQDEEVGIHWLWEGDIREVISLLALIKRAALDELDSVGFGNEVEPLVVDVIDEMKPPEDTELGLLTFIQLLNKFMDLQVDALVCFWDDGNPVTSYKGDILSVVGLATFIQRCVKRNRSSGPR